jgi:hypothetical protein
MKKIRPWKPRLRRVGGQWYAFAPNNSREAMTGLFYGIGICKRMNQRAAKRQGGE